MKILKSQKNVSECASALKLPTPILAELSKSVRVTSAHMLFTFSFAKFSFMLLFHF